MSDSINKKTSYRTIYITEPPISERSYKLRLDPVPFTITHNMESGQEFILTEKVSLYPGDHFQEDGPLLWTIKEGSGAAALLFRRQATAQEFAVLFGIYDDESLWSKILRKPSPTLTLEDELMNRYPPRSREGFGRGAGKVYDRVTVPLSGGECVKLVAKRCIVSSGCSLEHTYEFSSRNIKTHRPGYKVDITIFTEEEIDAPLSTEWRKVM
jgi:hypothetical protein